MTVQLQKATQ